MDIKKFEPNNLEDTNKNELLNELEKLPEPESFGLFKGIQEEIWENFHKTVEYDYCGTWIFKVQKIHPLFDQFTILADTKSKKQTIKANDIVDNLRKEVEACNIPLNLLLKWYQYLGVDMNTLLRNNLIDSNNSNLQEKSGLTGEIQDYYYLNLKNKNLNDFLKEVKQKICLKNDFKEVIDIFTKIYNALFKKFLLIHDCYHIFNECEASRSFREPKPFYYESDTPQTSSALFRQLEESEKLMKEFESYSVLFYALFDRFSTEWRLIGEAMGEKNNIKQINVPTLSQNIANQIRKFLPQLGRSSSKKHYFNELFEAQYKVFGPRMFRSFAPIGSPFPTRGTNLEGAHYGLMYNALHTDHFRYNDKKLTKKIEHLRTVSQFQYTKMTPGM